MKLVFILFLISVFAVGILGRYGANHDDYGPIWNQGHQYTKYCKEKDDEDNRTDPECCWDGAHVRGKSRYYQDPGKDVDCDNVKIRPGKWIKPKKAKFSHKCGLNCHCRSCKIPN